MQRRLVWISVFFIMYCLSIGWLPFSMRRPGKGRCSSGPYLIVPDCGEGEGIGSRMNYIKLGILYAVRTRSNFIQTRQCFWTDHDTDDLFAKVFGFDEHEDCHEDEIDRFVENGQLRRIDFLHPGADRAVELVREALMKSEMESQEIEDLMFLKDDSVMHSNSSPDSFLQFAAGYKRDRRNWRTVFVVHKSRDKSDDPSTNSGITFVESYLHTRHWIAVRYELAFQKQLREGKRSPLLFEKGFIHIAIHRRWGDIASGKGQALDYRTFPMEYYSNLMDNIMQDHVMRNKNIKVHVFSESNIEDLVDFPKKFKNFKFWKGSPETTIQDLDHLAHAHIFLGCRSSFSSLAAALNQNGVILAPDVEKFTGIDNVVFTSESGEFDPMHFRAAIIGAKLFKDNI